MSARAIHIFGPMGSGKTTLVSSLDRERIRHVPLSQVVGLEVARLSLPLTTANFQRVYKYMKAQYGNDIVARRTVAQVQQDRDDRIIAFDGARHPAEVIFMQQVYPGILQIYLDALPSTRFERALKREKSGDPTDQTELDVVMKTDLENVAPCRSVEGVVQLYNNGEIEDLQENFREVLQERGIEEVMPFREGVPQDFDGQIVRRSSER